jgi:hypothetical protein
MPEMRQSLLGGTRTDQDELVRWKLQRVRVSPVRNNRGMGATAVKMTVLGAVLIVAAIVAALMVLNVILDQKRSGTSGEGLEPE